MNDLDRYARNVVAGTIPAGTYHRLACARHLRDRRRERRGGRRFPYRFDYARAERFFRFAEKLRHYKGEWAGQYIVLQPHQKFRLGSLFAWVHRETGLRRIRNFYCEIPRKNGKALALDTPVPTPTGWTRHGDLKVGDVVFGADGRPKRIFWVGPVEHGPCFRLTVSTGESVVAHEHHEWITARTWFTGRQRGARSPRPLPPPIETKRIAETLRGGARGDYVHRIPVAAPFDLPEAALPIPPYTLGAWLGDGTASSGAITVGDEGIIDRIRQEGIAARAVRRYGGSTLYRLEGHQGSPQSFTSRLRRAGVLGAKRIPMPYLRASYPQRLEVLRGLVDTDGYRGARDIYEIVSVSADLAEDIRALVHSLGLKSTLAIDRAHLDGRDCGPRYRIQFSPDRDQVAALPRKQVTTAPPAGKRRSRARTITHCEPCDSVPTNCIQVEGGVYLVGRDCLQTHNSLEAAIVLLYLAFFDGEPGAEGFVIATKREQAKIVFNDCKRLVLSSGLRTRIAVLTANLHRDDTASKVEPLGADRDSTDGLNPSTVIIDEAHAMKHRGLIDVMETATGSRRQPVVFWITTAGSDPVTPCGDQHDYACKVLDRVLTDESLFAFIAHAEIDDDPFVEATWRKANPNYGISVKPDDMRTLALKARHMPAAADAFKQKRLNLWVNADRSWLSLEGWRRGQTAWAAEQLRGRACWIGIDLSSKIDLTAVVAVFPPEDLEVRWRLIAWCLTPADTLEERAHRDRAPYPQWVREGYLRTNPGNRIDQDEVRDIVRAACREFDVRQVGIDPWNAGNLVKDLTEDGLAVVEIPQTMAQMSQPSKDFEADVLDGLVDAGGNDLMTWCISNVVVQKDNKENIYPVKKRSRGRIDPVIAALIGRKLAALDTEPAADDPDLVVA